MKSAVKTKRNFRRLQEGDNRIANPKRKIVAQLSRIGSQEEREFDRRFWQNMDHEQKFAAAWAMVDEYLLIRGEEGVTQRRLQRSVQALKRRKPDLIKAKKAIFRKQDELDLEKLEESES